MSTTFNVSSSSLKTVSRTSTSERSIFTNVSDNAVESQDLIYKLSINNLTTIDANSTSVVNIGKIPTNGTIIGVSAFSEGVSNLSDQVEIAALLGRDTTSSTDSTGSEIIIHSKPYSNFISGIFNPSQPYHPLTELFRSSSVNSRFLNIQFKNNGNSVINLTTGEITVKINYMQADSNNTEADGYPTGGINVGPSLGYSSLPIPGSTPPTPPQPVNINPVSNLSVSYNLLPPGSPGYDTEYKPTFTWTLPANPITMNSDFNAVDRYMNWILYQLDSSGNFNQIFKTQYRSYTSSTPLGLMLDPFPFLDSTKLYRVQIEIVVHQDGFPEQTSSSFLTFGGNPYPAPPPPVINPPSQPINFVGYGGQYLITLAWDEPTDSGGSLITEYNVEQAEDNDGTPGIWGLVASPTNSFAVIQPLPDQTFYWYRVSAVNGQGAGPYSDTIRVETGPEPAQVPGIPVNLSAKAGHRQFLVSWEAPLNNGGKAITSYVLQIRTATGTFSTVYTGLDLSTSVTMIGGSNLADDTTYFFQVNATNSVGAGAFSAALETKTLPNITPTPPSAPVLRTATPGPLEVNLVWEPPTNSGSNPITNYTAEWSTGTTILGTLSTKETQLNIPGLTGGTKYYFRVKATSIAGSSPESNILSATPSTPATAPSVPRNFTLDGGVKEISVSWESPLSSGGSAITNYNLEWSVNADFSNKDSNNTIQPSVTSTTITTYAGAPLQDGTGYYVRIAARNGVVNMDGPFASGSAQTNKVINPPSAPLNLSADGMQSSILLSWDTPLSNGGASLQLYQVIRNPAFSSAVLVQASPDHPKDTITYTDSDNLQQGTTYTYTVSAKNTNNPNYGPSISTTGTLKPVPTKPDAPVLDSLLTGVAKLKANWTPGASNGGEAISSYNVEISSTGPSSGFSAAPGSPITNPQVHTLIITPLTGDTQYWVRVNSVNGVGPSDWSNVKFASPTSASGSCDGTCTGTSSEWNGMAGNPSFLPVPNPTATPLSSELSFGAEIFWNVTGLKFGIQKSVGGPGCVKNWELKIYQGNSLIATYPNSSSVTIPRNFYILNTPEGEHGKDPNTFIVSSLQSETSYTLRCEPQIDTSISPICSSPPFLAIPFTTGKPTTPPSNSCDTGATSGTGIEWSGTVTSVPENGTETNPEQIGAAIDWSSAKIKYSQCVETWQVKIYQTKPDPSPGATNPNPISVSPTFTTPTNFNIRNYGPTSWSTLSPQQLLPGTSYYLMMIPTRNSSGSTSTAPKNLVTEFKSGIKYTAIPSYPIPTGDPHLPKTYVTTYGIPSWGTTDMSSMLSQEYYSNGTPLGAKDSLTVAYNQHQSWAMVRNWAKEFFSPYISFIVDNPEITNAMVLVGDWTPILPGAGLPVQVPTIDSPGSGAKYGSVAGSNVLWDIKKANYSYCAPNGPVDFGLSYNQDKTVAPLPTGLTQWWEDDPDQLGCPLILDFLLPLARSLKGKGPNRTDRIISISVNGDVSKNGNDGAYGSLDCGNYTAADQRLIPSEAPTAELDCILGPQQVWEPKQPAGSCLTSPTWGPIGSNKTQNLTISISASDYNTLVAGAGAPGKPISQNNQGSNGLGTTGKIVSSSHNASTNIALFDVTIEMACVLGKGWRGDGGFSITNTDPSAKDRANAQVYFASPTDVTNPIPTTLTTYPITGTNPCIGAFLKNLVIQQSTNTGSFPTTNALLDPSDINSGGIIGQVQTTGPDAWTKYSGAAKVTVSLATGVTAESIKVYRTSGPTDSPPVYDTTFSHRIYFVSPSWDPNKNDIPGPPIGGGTNTFTDIDKIWNLRVGNLSDDPKNTPLLQCIYNYGTVDLSATPNISGGETRRALGNGSGNSTASSGGWLPNDWDGEVGRAHYPSYWNVAPNPKYLPYQPKTASGGASQANAENFTSAGSLVMGGGNVFIGNGQGSFCGRGSYFDSSTVTDSTTRPGLVTLSGSGTGVKGTFFSSNKSVSNPNEEGRIGFPLDNLHQQYILLYRINQKIMEFNYNHSLSSYTGPDKDLKIPYIGHVHHDKESYQVNKTPRYPICDSTGEISSLWLMGSDDGTGDINTLRDEIKSMLPEKYLVWKQNRRQTSVAYEKYLYNRYMPAEFLPDWRVGGANTNPETKHYLPLDTTCTIPGTGNRNSNGFGQTNGEPLWDQSKPWNIGQQRNFSIDPESTASRAETGKGIGNYSNDFKCRAKGDSSDGIQRYPMGWVNYAVTSWAYSDAYGQDLGSSVLQNPTVLPCTWTGANVLKGDLVIQVNTGATGVIAANAAAGTNVNVSIYTKQGTFAAAQPLTVFSTGTSTLSLTVGSTIITSPAIMFTSQGTNEAYQELYNIGEVKPPVNLEWLFDARTVDPSNQNPIVPSPSITVSTSSSVLDGYVGGTVEQAQTDNTCTPPNYTLVATILSVVNGSTLVLAPPNNPVPCTTLVFPTMFQISDSVSDENLQGGGNSITLKKAGGADPISSIITARYSPTENGPFPANFIQLTSPSTSNDYGTGNYELPTANGGNLIPNGLGSACIPGGSAPSCPGPGQSAAAVFCPLVTNPDATAVGPYYKLNAVTNTLIGRIFNKYGSSGNFPFLGSNSVNLDPSAVSPALTDLWLRYDAINTGVIPLDGRGYGEPPTGSTQGSRNGPKNSDGTFAPFQTPYVSDSGLIDLSNLYGGAGITASCLQGKEIVQGSDSSFTEPYGPRQAIALFANEYIGGALTLDPSARPGTTASQWNPPVKGEGAGTGGLPSAEYLPGALDSWVGSRGMEVVVYSNLVNNAMNKALLNLDGSPNPAFSKAGWQNSIETNDPTSQAIFKNIGWSFAANTWQGEYNGLSALQSKDPKVGYGLMKSFLRSCASMMSGPKDEEIGQSRVGLYTVGFLPETWLKGPSL